jgi:hypothetical protein
MASRYFEITTAAIKKYDSKHLLLGSKFHVYDAPRQTLFRAAGRFVDVVSMDYYFAWSPDQTLINEWAKSAGKPILIGEFYAKAMDTGMPNLAGAGWIVETQESRALFFENYTLGLLKNKNIVG